MRYLVPCRWLVVLALLALILGACAGSTTADTSSADCRDAAHAQAEAEFELSDELIAHVEQDAAVAAFADADEGVVAEHDSSQDRLHDLRAVSIIAEAEVRRVCG